MFAFAGFFALLICVGETYIVGMPSRTLADQLSQRGRTSRETPVESIAASYGAQERRPEYLPPAFYSCQTTMYRIFDNRLSLRGFGRALLSELTSEGSIERLLVLCGQLRG